jgi:hypothetical protein
MSALHDLKDRLQRRADGADLAAEVDQALLEARRKLSSGRDRLGEAATDTVEELRDGADDAVRDARRRARGVRKRARRQARALRAREPEPAIVVAALAGLFGLLAVIAQRRSLRSSADRGMKAVGGAVRRAGACAPRLRDALGGRK